MTESWELADGTHQRLSVEIRTINSRFREIKINQPFGQSCEQEIRTSISQRIGRGRVDVVIHWQEDESAQTEAKHPFHISEQKIRSVLATVAKIQAVSVQEEVELSVSESMKLLKLILRSTPRWDPRQSELQAPKNLANCVQHTLDKVCAMREKEGIALEKELIRLTGDLNQKVQELEKLTENEGQRLSNYFQQRIQEFCRELDRETVLFKNERILQEAALLAQKSDVKEEIARLYSHLNQIQETLANPATPGQGKTLDFLCQELFRELSTLGSKIAIHEGSAVVISAKGIVEQLREQAQNVE